MSHPTWLQQQGSDCLITVRVTPRASRSGVLGEEAEWLRIRLQAPPVDGKANAALIEWLADTIKRPKRTIALISGDTNRLKRLRITDITPEELIAKLNPS